MLWTDNLPDTRFGFETALRAGRLHRALAGVAPHDPAPPEVTLQPRAQRLRSRDAVVVRARCSAACDLCAVAGADADGGPAGVGAAQLDRAGTARIAVRPGSRDGMVPRGGGPLRVTVHATAPGGARPTVARLDVRARHAFVPPPRRPLDVRVARRGDRLVVTWRTARPARSEVFEVNAEDRFEDLVGLDELLGRGRTRFRSVISLLGKVSRVEIAWSSTEPRLRGGRLTVPVPGGER